MQCKTRSQKRSREFTPRKLAGCFGDLTQGPNLPIGSSIGQVSEAQISSTNLLRNTAAPLPGAGGGGTWTFNGDSTLNQAGGLQWDAGFISETLITNAGGAANFVDDTLVALPATQYAIQGQFSTDPALMAASGFAQPSATFVRMAVNWTGGAARLDFLDFNPSTGQVIATSPGVSNVSITRFNTLFQINGVGAATPAVINLVSFITAPTPAGTNAGDYRLFANVGAGAAKVQVGALQVEQGTIASAYISTPATATASRAIGLTPRNSVDRTVGPVITLAANFQILQETDLNTTYVITTNGVTFNLAASTLGDWVDIYFTGTTFCQIQNGTIFGPGLPVAGVPQVRMPYDGTIPAGGIGPYNVSAARFVNVEPGLWQMFALAETHGTLRFIVNGTFTPGNGMTTVWVDASGGGSGGGGAAAVNSAGAGGGAGDAVKDSVLTVIPGSAINITIGTGGNGGAAGNNQGAVGTNTIIGALLTVIGSTQGGTGAATGTFPNSSGGNFPGNPGFATTLANFGGLGAGNIFTSPSSVFGIANPNGSTGGQLGKLYGGGGTGGASGTVGGAAAPGGAGAQGFASIRW